MEKIATHYGPSPLQEVIALMRSIPRYDPPVLFMNPANKAIFHHPEFTLDKADLVDGLEVRFIDALQERRTRTVWHPPKDGRFTEYGPEDEHWMRPLGLGTVEEVDDGPLIYEMQRSVLERMERECFRPAPLYAEGLRYQRNHILAGVLS